MLSRASVVPHALTYPAAIEGESMADFMALTAS
jgi:hypothetical protein